MAIPRTPLGSGPIILNPYPVKFLSCWHLLSILMTMAACIFACFLMMKNLLFFQNVDYIADLCLVDWESSYPCHIMHLWWVLNEHNSVELLRCFLNTMFVFTIAVAGHYIIAGLIMIIGTAKRNHLAMVPWLVVKALVTLIIAGLVSAEVYITGGSIHSSYFMVSIAILVFSVFHWTFGYVAFSQLRQMNVRTQQMNNFNYIRFAN